MMEWELWLTILAVIILPMVKALFGFNRELRESRHKLRQRIGELDIKVRWLTAEHDKHLAIHAERDKQR